MSRKQFVIGAVAAGSWLAACAPAPEPVGHLEVFPQQLELGFSEFARVELHWSPTRELAELEGTLRVFVHLLDEDGDVLRTFDHPFPEEWRPGAEIRYEIELYQSALGDPVEPGSYDLIAGLYDDLDHRWALHVKGRERGRLGYKVATVEVPVEQGLVPMLYFSEAWLDLEPGSDQQVLARRWLSEGGIIRITEVPGPGTFRFVIEIPGGGEREGGLVLDEGWNEPTVEVDGDCTDSPVTISGEGRHVFLLHLPGAGPECAVTFEPRFRRVRDEVDQRRALVLENVAWSDAAG